MILNWSATPSGNQLEEELNRLYRWALDWGLPLNVDKCYQLTLWGADANSGSLEDGDKLIKSTAETRHLGIHVTDDFITSVQCNLVRKSNHASYLLRRSVVFRKLEVLVLLYKVYVRPLLAYCVQAWSPSLIKYKNISTKLFLSIQDKTYFKRLKTLNLFSLERCRLQSDLSEAYKCIAGIDQTTTPLS